MEDLFTMLSSSARFSKQNQNKTIEMAAGDGKEISSKLVHSLESRKTQDETKPELFQKDNEGNSSEDEEESIPVVRSRDRTGKRDMSEEKRLEIQKEQIAAFRRSMNIRVVNNKQSTNLPDPISSFSEISKPTWWKNPHKNDSHQEDTFESIHRTLLRNVEAGKWKEPTAIQMQAIPSLMQRRDFIGSAPTGSGKSGAFIIPSLFLSSAPDNVFYQTDFGRKKNQKGCIRALLLAPSLELSSQLFREVERLGTGKKGGLSAMLLTKANATNVIAGAAGGKKGLDVLVATPLRLVDAIEKGLKLDAVRIVVLDEADRLLDAADGRTKSSNDPPVHKNETSGEEKDTEENEEDRGTALSGSARCKTFLAQIDIILGEIPVSAVRALFSATVTFTVRSLSESILRNPDDIAVGKGDGTNSDVEQKLCFVSNEQGKLLAIRQLVQRGELRPPVIVFLQSQERAQALFEELLYDNIHVDVIHAARSRAAREKAVTKFRRGETWVLICTDLVARGVDFRAVNMVINYDLPSSGITYVHRIGRTGRAGRKGTAITLFTEADFENLRTIANIMRQSGCQVDEWMLNMKKRKGKNQAADQRLSRGHDTIDTTSIYDKKGKRRKELIIRQSKEKKAKAMSSNGET